jgi:hypothetical protein
VNGVAGIASRTKPAFKRTVFRDSTVKCQSNHPPKSVHVSSGYRHKRFVESQTNTPPDQLSEAQIFQNTSSGISRFFVLLGT